MSHNDRELGMHRRITRRDFLNGVAISAGALATASKVGAAPGDLTNPEDAPDYYPPVLTGMRGDHDDIYKVPHSIRDHAFWQTAGAPSDTGEEYDLVIVGGGISGLAAAHFYRKATGNSSRVLILENHDDFGGHAKRNEFHQTGRLLLGYGGTFSIESPSPYSAVAKRLIEELGIDVSSTGRVFDRKLYPKLGLSPSVFFDKETFGRDVLVVEPVPDWYSDPAPKRTADQRWNIFFNAAPIAEAAKHDLRRLYEDKKDYLPGLSSDEKKARMARMSYAKFLTDVAAAHPDVVKYFQARPYGWFGLGIDAVAAQDAWGLGYPGFDGMNLDPKPGPGQNRDTIRSEDAERYFYHFPDGNSSIARLLVRSLIPEAVPGKNALDILTARTNFALLDKKSCATRIRLNSTVVRVRHIGDPGSAQSVEITYVRLGKLQTIRASKCILACWHVMIPYICTELPQAQKTALASAAKVPLVYTNVVIRNWNSFQKLGVSSIYAPGSFHSEVNLDLPVSLGTYKCPHVPDESIVVHMQRVPTKPGLPSRAQHRAGRLELFNTSFETFERNIRDQLARSLSPGGFDPAKDIAAITVNRWPHGYAYEYNSLWDDFWLEGGPQPCVAARQPFGRIAIANSDAGAYAYTDGAIDQGHRAVEELLAHA
ncbi:MAG TPA: NAD(P)-binding protein [Bryobacteraceae bacterium]|jgi:spermidine dehydrogenase|nr:NAD(P)-binding protein [Bryobacteraceae bacterium]